MTSSLLPLCLALRLAQPTLPDRALTLDEAVRAALQNSPHLKAARMQAQAARAENEREKPVARPTVTAEAVGQLQGPRVTFPRPAGPDAVVIPERYGRVQISLEQLLYRAGAGAARTRYDAQNRAADLDLAKSRNDLILEVKRAYFAAVSARSMAEVARQGMELARAQLELTKSMVEAGTASVRDLKASDADLAETEQSLSKAENGATAALANLKRLLGEDSIGGLVLPQSIEAASVLPTSTGVDQALRSRPEIRQIEENLRAARAGADLAATQNMPSLSGRATALAQTPTGFTDTKFYSAGFSVTWQPFDTGKTRADVQAARARVAQLEALLDETRSGIRLEVEKAIGDIREAQGRFAPADRQVASAEAALEVSRVRYQAGAATQMEVSASLLAVTRARANRAQAALDLHSAAADYAHATGADLEPDTQPRAGKGRP